MSQNGAETPTAETIAPPIAIQAAAANIVDNLNKMSELAQGQVVATCGAAAILACLPGTADIDAQELGAVIAAITRGRKDEAAMRDKVAIYAAKIIDLARRARAATAPAAAANRMSPIAPRAAHEPVV